MGDRDAKGTTTNAYNMTRDVSASSSATPPERAVGSRYRVAHRARAQLNRQGVSELVRVHQLLLAAERERIEAAIPKNTRIVALDERGTTLTTKALAQRLQDWQLSGDDVALVIGGPDGLQPAFRQAAHERVRLSDLTLPHAMARVLLIEQLYRAWSVNAGHPYHRE